LPADLVDARRHWEAMMKKSLILLAFVAGCGASDQGRQKTGDAGAKASTPAAPISSTTLTGLYEGGDSAKPSQLCVVEKKGQAAFGLIIWGAKASACGGAGIIEREGEQLHLRMTGDQACRIGATIRDGTITFDGPVPAGCAYYCGAPARFAGTAFTRKGATLADAMKARDPAGDPLCSS
jgi:hypothetical protein